MDSDVQPWVGKFGRNWLEWFGRGQGIWRQIFEKCQIPTPCPASPPPPTPPADLTLIGALAQLCSDDSIKILLNLTWVWTFRPQSNMKLLAVNNNSNKTISEKRILYFSYIRLQKQYSSLMYWLKTCKAWVRSQLRGARNWLKLNVTSSNVLRIINNYSLTISTQKCRINTKKFNTKGT